MLKRLLAAFVALFLAAAAYAAVDVNTASQADLETIKGIGPSISKKIIDERKNGNYKDWNDLVTRVKGVGDKNAAKFSTGGLTVGGTSFSGAPAAAAPAAKKEPAKTAAPAAAPASAAAPATAAAPAPSASAATKTKSKKSKSATPDANAAMTTTSKASQPQTK
ncbi:MAG: helix-hairpin-helix domain-containing protein [Proteobacteria bacterium]|nr:helix-hairpin-helix domain-containing protein [Pseudomonadota bacterium]